MHRNFAINVIGPSLVLKYFAGFMPREEVSVWAAISARVGSISDNKIGGWYSYRASKAALNMIIKTASIELARKYKKASLIGLHPGTVDTTLSKPFQGGVKHEIFTPQKSAQALLSVLTNASFEISGKIYAFDGQEILP
jgi:NAD(P)-dependent dehydrogenase (short-subunit alcohol dehydrogenase family)